jgi:hypothetical protein
MTLYSVFDRRLDEAPAVVPDRFSWFAALLPPVFGLVHGLWLALLSNLVGVALIGSAGLWLGPEAGIWLYVLFAILIVWQPSGVRRRAVRRRGYIHRAEHFADADDLADVDSTRRRSALSSTPSPSSTTARETSAPPQRPLSAPPE